MAKSGEHAGVATKNESRYTVEVAFTGLERPCNLAGIRKIKDLKSLLAKECGVPPASYIVLIGKPYKHPRDRPDTDIQEELARVDAQRRNMFLYDRREIDSARKSLAAGSSESAPSTDGVLDPAPSSTFWPTKEQLKSIGGESLHSLSQPLRDTPDEPFGLLRALDGELPERARLAAARLSAAIAGGGSSGASGSDPGGSSDHSGPKGSGEGGSGPATVGSYGAGHSGAGGSSATAEKLQGPALAVFHAMRSRFARIVGWHRMAKVAPRVLRERVNGGVAAAQRAGVRARALDAAMSNLVDVAAGSLRRFEGFYRRFVRESTERKQILYRAPEYCSRLAEVTLHPELARLHRKKLKRRHAAAAGAGAEQGGSKAARTGTLLDHVDERGTLDWAQKCTSSETRLAALAKSLHGDVEEFFRRCEEAAKEPAVPETVSTGIRERVQALESRAEEGWEAADEALRASEEAVTLLHANIAALAKQASAGSGSPSGSDSRDALDALQKKLEDELLPALMADDDPLRSRATGICAAESFVLDRLKRGMAKVSGLHREIASLNRRMQQLAQADKMQRGAVAHIRRVRGMPAAYTTALREVSRRRAFARHYVAYVQHVWDSLERARTRESQRRAHFDRMHGGVLPAGLFPGMEEKAPVFEVRWEGIVSKLPRIDNVADFAAGAEADAQDEAGDSATSAAAAGAGASAAGASAGAGAGYENRASASASPKEGGVKRNQQKVSDGSDDSAGQRVRELRLAEVTLDYEEDLAANGMVRKLGLEAEVAGLKAELAQMAQWYGQGSGLGEEALKEYLDGHVLAASRTSSPTGAGPLLEQAHQEGSVQGQTAAQPDSLATSPEGLPDTLPWTADRIPTAGYSLREHILAGAGDDDEDDAQLTHVARSGTSGGPDSVPAGTALAASPATAGLGLPAGVSIQVPQATAGESASSLNASDTGDDSVFDFVVSPVVGSERRLPTGLLAPHGSSSAASESVSRSGSPAAATTPVSDDAVRDSGGPIGRSLSAASADRGSRVVRRLQHGASAGNIARHGIEGGQAMRLLSNAKPRGKLSAGQALWKVLSLLRDSRAVDAAENAQQVHGAQGGIAGGAPRWLGAGGGRQAGGAATAAAVAAATLRPSHSEGEVPEALLKGLGMISHFDVDSHDDTDADGDEGASTPGPLGLVLGDSSTPQPTEKTQAGAPKSADARVTSTDIEAIGSGSASARRSKSQTPTTRRDVAGLANLRPGRVVEQLRKVLRYLAALQHSNVDLNNRIIALDQDRRERAVLYGSVSPQDIVVFHARHVPAAAGYSGSLMSHPAEAHTMVSADRKSYRKGHEGDARGGKKGRGSKGKGKGKGNGGDGQETGRDGRPRGESDRSSESSKASVPAFVYEAIQDRRAGAQPAAAGANGKPTRMLLRARCADQAVTMAGGSWPSVVVGQVRKVLRRVVPGSSSSSSTPSRGGMAREGEAGSMLGDSSQLGSSATRSTGRFSPAVLDEIPDDELSVALQRFGLEPGSEFLVAVADVLFVDEDEKDD